MLLRIIGSQHKPTQLPLFGRPNICRTFATPENLGRLRPAIVR